VEPISTTEPNFENNGQRYLNTFVHFCHLNVLFYFSSGAILLDRTIISRTMEAIHKVYIYSNLDSEFETRIMPLDLRIAISTKICNSIFI